MRKPIIMSGLFLCVACHVPEVACVSLRLRSWTSCIATPIVRATNTTGSVVAATASSLRAVYKKTPSVALQAGVAAACTYGAYQWGYKPAREALVRTCAPLSNAWNVCQSYLERVPCIGSWFQPDRSQETLEELVKKQSEHQGYLEANTQTLQKLSQQYADLYQQYDKMHHKFDHLEERFDHLTKKIDALQEHMKTQSEALCQLMKRREKGFFSSVASRLWGYVEGRTEDTACDDSNER